MARDYAYRTFKRAVKAERRLREDRAQHGNDGFGPNAWLCSCFNPDGRTYARFAEYPAICSSMCCGNKRQWEGPSVQERRAPTITDWQDLSPIAIDKSE